MRSWSSRQDTHVIDEPFYAHYLQETGLDHPGASEIINYYETDWRRVVENLLANGRDEPIYYQKHMTHHMLENIDRSWLREVSNCFLIRDPRRMLLSLAKVIPQPRLQQTGLPQQVELFHYVAEVTGKAPPVIAARDVLLNPESMLRRLCAALAVPFDSAMLCWSRGKRISDGIWGKYWYGAVERSTGFAPYQEDDTALPQHLQRLLDQCQALYEQMAQHRIH